jgi:transposase
MTGTATPPTTPRPCLALLYGYCIGMRSSRQLERRCTEDIAFRVLAGNQLPDHVTIARFRVRHEHALAGFLVGWPRPTSPTSTPRPRST